MKIIIITGQTATGKTKLALEYAQKYNGELINCDSRQIYKELDIITGKDLEKSSKFKAQSSKLNFDIGYYELPISTSFNPLRRSFSEASQFQPVSTKIWLYDIIPPDQYFSSFDNVQCALPLIKKIIREGKTPIIIGGTYFYLYHLLYNVHTQSVPPDWNLRKKLEKLSVEELKDYLSALSKESLKHLNNSYLNNPQRLIRKIEIIKSFKKTQRSRIFHERLFLSDSIKLPAKLGIHNLKIVFYGLKNKNHDQLRQKIIDRVNIRLEQGAFDEVKQLIQKGYSAEDPGLKTIGYRQIIKYLKGETSKDFAIEQWINKEIQYAKRQYTFMKRDKNIKWIELA